MMNYLLACFVFTFLHYLKSDIRLLEWNKILAVVHQDTLVITVNIQSEIAYVSINTP